MRLAALHTGGAAAAPPVYANGGHSAPYPAGANPYAPPYAPQAPPPAHTGYPAAYPAPAYPPHAHTSPPQQTYTPPPQAYYAPPQVSGLLTRAQFLLGVRQHISGTGTLLCRCIVVYSGQQNILPTALIYIDCTCMCRLAHTSCVYAKACY